MKKAILLFFHLLLTIGIIQAQNSGFKWQGLAQDANGNAITEPVTMTFSIVQNNVTVYSETHPPTIPTKGQLTFTVGKGTPVTGVFSNIDWSVPSSLDVKMKVVSGQVLDMGMSEILLPPYLYSLTSGGAKYVGSYALQGDADGTVVIKNGYWQQATRTTYNGMEGIFSNIPVTPGMAREYYLAIQSADNINTCANQTEWRFYFTWQNKPGHKFLLSTDFGNVGEGAVKWIKVPSPESQAQQLGLGNQKYWRLESKIPGSCTSSVTEMRVYSISVFAVDRPNGSSPAITLSSDATGGNAAPTQIGPNGKLRFESNGQTTIQGTVNIEHGEGYQSPDITSITDNWKYGLIIRNTTNNNAWTIRTTNDAVYTNGKLAFYRHTPNVGSGGYAAAVIGTNGSWNQSSDARLKTNISSLAPVLMDILSLEPKSYNYNYPGENPNGKKSIGFLAQDVQSKFPELVESYGPEGECLLALDYSGFGVLAIKAIQEQQVIIDKLQKQVEALTLQIEKLSANR